MIDMRDWVERRWPAPLRGLIGDLRRPLPTPGRPRLALLDSGFSAIAALRGSRIVFRDFAGDAARPCASHGTRHAALVAGCTARYRGLAPGCDLALARVPTGPDMAAGSASAALAAAIRWALEIGAQAILCPLAGRRAGRDLASACVAAERRRVPVFASAGNRGPDFAAFPARLPGAIAVGGFDTRGAPLGSGARAVAIRAPGSAVPVLDVDGPGLARGSSPAAVIAGSMWVLDRIGEAAPCWI